MQREERERMALRPDSRYNFGEVRSDVEPGITGCGMIVIFSILLSMVTSDNFPSEDQI